MTNKELKQLQILTLLIAALFAGLIIGSIVTQIRINSEIRHDQLELQAQIAQIIESKATIDDLTQKLIVHIEQLKVEWREVRELQEKLSKGEMK